MTARTISLSLISHTNAGKTTLARTLLGRDVGEVRDAPHVTAEATSYPLIESAEGDVLLLWDTPGFGDSARLARRLRQQGNPIGWLLSQVWDRFRDRAFWHTQQAVRNVRDSADVVLYLVNAGEAPADAGYLVPELAVLEWLGKPVIVLLNQTGPPRPREADDADVARWREALGGSPVIRQVLALDAFARCWVQEFRLFAAVHVAVPESSRPAVERVTAAWRARRLGQFDAAMAAIARALARAAADRVGLPAETVLQRLGKSLGVAREGDVVAETVEAMTRRLADDVKAVTDELLAIHGLAGSAADELLARVADDLRIDAPVDEGKAALLGGVVSGALTGLGADLAAGGLTLGAGLLTGAVLGALGGMGVARGVNLVRGRSGSVARWDDAFLDRLAGRYLVLYLAVAHFGRGRGEWRGGAPAAFWSDRVAHAVDRRRDRLTTLWSAGRDGAGNAPGDALQRLLAEASRELLEGFHPDTAAAWGPTDH